MPKNDPACFGRVYGAYSDRLGPISGLFWLGFRPASRPKTTSNGPKTAENGQKRPRKAPRGPRARVMTPRSPSGAHRTQFRHLSNPQSHLHRLFRPILGRFGPNRGATDGPGVKSEKWPYRSPDVPNRDFEGTILGCNPPVWVVSTPQNGLNARLGPRTGPRWGVDTVAHPARLSAVRN